MRSVIIPAAGLATRMKPLSRGVSKAMIPVNGRPLISYIIEKIYEDPEVSEVVIIENELGDINEFVSRVYPDKNIRCFVQDEKLGPLHAINIGFKQLEDISSNVTIWLGDTICLDNFNYNRSFLAVHQVSDPHRWCLVDKDGKLYDKPDGQVSTDSAIIGVYNFTDRKAFNHAMEKGMSKPTHKGEYQIAALLEFYMKKDGPMELAFATEWYDCGELNTYYESKARLLKRTARSFNRIEVDTFYGTVTKTSEDDEKQNKIQAEKNWFKNLDENQSLFCPRILKSEPGSLRMTLEPGIALNEVLVYDNLRTDIWHDIIRKILKVHHEVFYSPMHKREDYEDSKLCFDAYYLKTYKRLKSIWEVIGHRDTDLEKFLLDTSLELVKDPKWSSCIHGDSHLGNIIYDPHSGNIKFVDPRGEFGGFYWNQGDIRYDMAKLLQDFYCGYAMILAKRYTGNIISKIEIDWAPGTQDLSKFLENELHNHGYDVTLLKKLSILLLVTAIPFHSDDRERQMAFYVRAKNLLAEF
jgi:glucose-1-phosphate thymidylyltransferase